MLSQKNIADVLGVSQATVAGILKGGARAAQFRPELREEVIKTALKLGYRRNLSALTMRTGFNRSTVGFICDGNIPSSLPWHFKIIEELNDCDFGVRIYRTGELEKAFRELLSNQIRYVIVSIASARMRSEAAALCRENKLRAVFYGTGKIGPDIPVFSPDFSGMMAIAIDKLYALGHRRISLLCAKHEHGNVLQLHEAYVSEMKRHALKVNAGMSICHDFTEGEFLDYVERERPTALCCIDGWVGTNALNFLLRHGVRIPDEISIVAMTGAWTPQTIIPLSLVTYEENEVSRALVASLLDKPDAPVCDSEGQVLFGGIFCEGGTMTHPPLKMRKFKNLGMNDIFKD